MLRLNSSSEAGKGMVLSVLCKGKNYRTETERGVAYFLDEKTGTPSGQNRNIFTEYRNIEIL